MSGAKITTANHRELKGHAQESIAAIIEISPF